MINTVMAKIRYEAGRGENGHYVVRLPYNQSALAREDIDFIGRIVEFWCQKHCDDEWRVEETDRDLAVSFMSTRDATLFKISEEYDYFPDRLAASE